MAKLITKKYQNKNARSAAFNKWYGRFVYTETLSFDEFINHISSHSTPFDRGTIKGVMTTACDCLVELTMDSKKVCLSDLGTFYASAESEGEVQKDDYSAKNVKKVHLRFLPNMKKSYPLDSVTLREKASLIDLDALNGKPKDEEEG